MLLSPKVMFPVIVPPAKGNLVAILFVTVVLKLASSPNAAANSFSVFKASGELSTNADISCCTKAVEAGEVSLSPEDAVAIVIVLPIRSSVPANFAAVIALSEMLAVVIASDDITSAVIFCIAIIYPIKNPLNQPP